MRKAKSSRRRQKADTPAFIVFAEQLSRAVCTRFGTTPKLAAEDLINTIATDPAHGLKAIRFSEIWRNPLSTIQRALPKGALNAEIAEEQLAAALWLAAQRAKALIQHGDGSAQLGEITWTLSSIATALQFPALRGQILRTLRPEIDRSRKIKEAASLGGYARAARFEDKKKQWQKEANRLKRANPHLSRLAIANKIAGENEHNGKVETIRKNIRV